MRRLEGWPRDHAFRPSFETLASQAPQDEGSVAGRLRGALREVDGSSDDPHPEERTLVRVSKDEAPELANALAAAGGRAKGSAVAPGLCPRADSTSRRGEKARVPERLTLLAAQYSPWYRLALVKPG
jgi:hypothetical protein